jgi:hypothetical protein
MDELRDKLARNEFVSLQPFGRALSASLRRARRLPNGRATWEEVDEPGGALIRAPRENVDPGSGRSTYQYEAVFESPGGAFRPTFRHVPPA